MSTADEFLPPWTAGPDKDYSKDTNYAVGVNIITEWVADYSNATITLNQDNKPGDAQGGPSVTLEVSYNKTTWGWPVSYEGMDPAYNNVFYFSVSQADGSDSFTSHYFNISNALTTTKSSIAAAQSTTSKPSSSTLASTTLVSSGSTTLPSLSPGTVTVAPSSNGGTTVGTTVGIVVGTIFGTLLLVGGAWWIWRFKKKRGTTLQAQPLNVAPDQPHLYEEQKPHEAGGNQRFELHQGDERQLDVFHESGGRPVHELHNSVR